MLKIRVIPTLTIKGEKLVKSVQFSEHRNIGSYIAAVRVFNARDVDELIFLDLDAHDAGIQTRLLESVTKECYMPVTLGGGVRSVEDVQTMLSAGADKVSINTAALHDPDLIAFAVRRFGNQCVVVSIDAKKEGTGWNVYGGVDNDTGRDVVDWAREVETRGAGEILLHSIDRDGTMEGFDLPLIEHVTNAVRIPVIALGGAGTVEHCVDAVRNGASAVSASSIFQYTQTTPQAIKLALHAAGFPARIG